MIVDDEHFERSFQLAFHWASELEEYILLAGASLGPRHAADARRAGVQNESRVRVLAVDRIPFPDDKDLAAAARRAHIITDASRAITLGYGIVVRGDCWHDRELLLHQFVHVAQYERAGTLEICLRQYFLDRRDCAKFTCGSLEEEARRIAREICAEKTSTIEN